MKQLGFVIGQQDQSARRLAQKYLNIVDPDYYELETHIFFDDAFEMSDDDEDEVVVNRFVRILVNSMDEAASFVHQVSFLFFTSQTIHNNVEKSIRS